jgi:hypothetical protein
LFELEEQNVSAGGSFKVEPSNGLNEITDDSALIELVDQNVSTDGPF